MYTATIVLADNSSHIMYDDDPDHVDAKLLSPKLEMEENTAGSFEATIPPTNYWYDHFQNHGCELIITRTFDDTSKEIWRGRPLSGNKDFFMNHKVHFEGELSYLNDSVQEPHEYKDVTPEFYFRSLLKIHNSKMPVSKQFQPGRVTVTDDHSSDYITKRVNYGSYNTSYDTHTLDAILDMINSLGGHLEIRRSNGVRYLDYLADYEHTATQVLQFGENLLDYAEEWNLSNLYTVCVPIGDTETTEDENGETKSESVTIKSVNNGSPYVVNNATLAVYGRRETVVLFANIIEPANLLKLGSKWLTSTQFDNMVLKINALDMSYLTDSQEPIDFLYNVRAVSSPHGLDKYFPLTKMSIVLNDPQQSVYTMATESRKTKSMSTAIRDHDKEISSIVEGLETTIKETVERMSGATSANPDDDWVYGSPVIIYPSDERQINWLEHMENCTHVYVPSDQYLIYGSDSKLSGLRNAINDEDEDENSSIRYINSTHSTDPYCKVGKDTSNSEAMNIPTGCWLYAPIKTESGGCGVVYFVGKFMGGASSYIGRRYSSGGGGEPLKNNYTASPESNHLACFAGSDVFSDVTFDSSTSPSWTSGDTFDTQNKWIVIASMYGVVKTDTYQAYNLLVADQNGIYFPTNTNQGGLGEVTGYGVNYYAGRDWSSETAEHELSMVMLAACTGAVGQITMDEVIDNINYLRSRYLGAM